MSYLEQNYKVVPGNGEPIPELAQNIKSWPLWPTRMQQKHSLTLAISHFNIEAINDETLRMKLKEADPHTLSEATQSSNTFWGRKQ